jgi:hypothetical protein
VEAGRQIEATSPGSPADIRAEDPTPPGVTPDAFPFKDGSPPRILAEMGPQGPGPTLIVVSGLHGNEPAGVTASIRVLEALGPRAGELRGRIHFLVGNREAVARGVRYVHRDLNRAWTRDQVQGLTAAGESAEDREQLELLTELTRIVERSRGPVYALDLHTTSGPDGVFTTVGDTLENRSLARSLPVPLVLGLEELVDGTLHDYLESLGLITLAFESGQHLEPEAVDRAEAAIWVLLAASGLLPESLVPELSLARSRLGGVGRTLPRVVELRYRHPISEEDGFRMRPGFRSFQRIRRGDELADDRKGPVRAPESGRLLMPLYQSLGDDGFFSVREVRVFWLGVSRLLRAVRMDRVVHLLPGIRKHPVRPGVLVVDQRVARWYALQLMHLLGFRRYREEGNTLLVLRRGVPEEG